LTTASAVPASTVTLVAPETLSLAPVLAAAQAAWPAAVIRQFPSFETAWGAPPGAGLEVLALFNAGPVDLDRAAAAVDASALPRWAVIAFAPAGPTAALVTLASTDWPPSALAELFRAAAARHRSDRDRIRLQGDMRTIGSRIVHDLRTPLSGILTTAEVLAEALAEASPRDAGLPRSIITCCDELKKTIQQLSIVAKTGAHPPARERLNMGLAVGPALMRLERRAAETGVAIAHPPDWPEVAGDAAWLDLIWSNLAGNALRHAGPKRRVELGWERVGGELHFWVSDDGIGVAQPATLFREFHLLDQPNAGRGLGLSLVQRLVERQGGRCSYAPRAGGGSTFSFYLPAL